MALADAIFARLSAAPAVATLVGDRIEPDTATATTFPLIVYTMEQEQDPTLGQDATTTHYTVTVTVEAMSRAEADAVAAAVGAALHDAAWTTGATKVIACTFTGATRDAFAQDGNKEARYFGVSAEFSVYADNG